MKKPVSKHRQPLIRTAVYGVMTLTVVTIVSLLMLVVLGYSFNEKDGRLEQGGLLQFSSMPTGATVTLDELTLGTRTNTKATVDSGSHSVSLDRQGYRTWKKTISIEPGQIGWLNYARLIPTKVDVKDQRTFPALSASLASPNGKWILMQEAVDQPTFELVDIQNDSVKYTTLVLPELSYTAPAEGMAHTFTMESWSKNEESILVRHTYDQGAVEWLLLNRDSPDRTVNITKALGINPSKLVFAGDNDTLLFVQTDDMVRRINLDNMTLSRPLVTGVESFTPFDDKMVTYVTTADAEGKRTVGYATLDIDQPVPVQTYPADGQPLQAAIKVYFNKRYLSIIHGQSLVIRSGTLPTVTDKGDMKLYAQATIPAGVIRLTVSDNGRFIVSELPEGYATYDLELKKYDQTTWAYPTTAPRPLQWLDNYMIWSDNGGELRTYDFDGANQQTIMKVVEGQAATLSPNGKYLYGVTKSEDGVSLSRVQLMQ